MREQPSTEGPRLTPERPHSQEHQTSKNMRILVIGASQGTGALTVRAALAKGHQVTAFARSPQKLVLEHAQLERVTGDFHQAASVEPAIAGHDAVIVTASATSMSAFKENPRYFSQGTGHVIEGMKKAGVKRLVVLSASGVGESRRLFNPIMRLLLIDGLLKAPYEDHERQEQQVRSSGLDGVIARPGRLTNGPARGKFQKKTAIEPLPSAISRADVAAFLVEACEGPTWVGQAVLLGG
jgi:uncharacterized protein YbjT (DUF2867 family)